MPISRIISGGQTGADRAALDAAIEAGIEHGGWAPRGRRAEDGTIAPQYRLGETPDADYSQRTEWNVRDSDATLIISRGPLQGGSELTRTFARHYAKPVLHLDLSAQSTDEAADTIVRWLDSPDVATLAAILNVAGPRASEDKEIYRLTKSLLTEVFKMMQREG